jgi:hypothetical protein
MGLLDFGGFFPLHMLKLSKDPAVIDDRFCAFGPLRFNPVPGGVMELEPSPEQSRSLVGRQSRPALWLQMELHLLALADAFKIFSSASPSKCPPIPQGLRDLMLDNVLTHVDRSISRLRSLRASQHVWLPTSYGLASSRFAIIFMGFVSREVETNLPWGGAASADSILAFWLVSYIPHHQRSTNLSSQGLSITYSTLSFSPPPSISSAPTSLKESFS